MEKEINIVAPEGYEIDKENSTFECIKFKPAQKKRWRDDKNANIRGYFLTYAGDISDQYSGKNEKENNVLFATEKQAKSALAMARISQIMANDERFGGVVTDKEWRDADFTKFAIRRSGNFIDFSYYFLHYHFLAFHTPEQRDLFLEENKDLVKDYLMID